MLKVRLSIVSIVSIMSLWFMVSPSPIAAQDSPKATGTECTPFAIRQDTDSFPEIEGKSEHQELWALLFPYHLPIRTDEDIKIVWRMTGVGTFQLFAQHTDGTIIPPIWGPEEHGGSSWHRPGEEWGTGFHFPKAGCWRIVVQYGTDSGEVDLLIVDPPEWQIF
ncbi:MAG: hypothetical protein ABI947_29995 [Chloroflexota bacterium]